MRKFFRRKMTGGIVLAVLFCCGFTFYLTKVNLKSTEPLIDLSERIVDSKPGNGGLSENGQKDPGSVTDREEKTEIKDSETKGETGTEAVKVEITITVTDGSVFLDEQPVKDAEELVKELSAVLTDGMTVCLVDDYAGYAAYKEVRAALSSLSVPFEEVRK